MRGAFVSVVNVQSVASGAECPLAPEFGPTGVVVVATPVAHGVHAGVVVGENRHEGGTHEREFQIADEQHDNELHHGVSPWGKPNLL